MTKQSRKNHVSLKTKQLSLLALLSALLVVLGLVNIPMPAGLSITFNMIPVAIAAIVMGVPGGAIMGGVFGLISFLQCFGILGFSGMGAALVSVSPLLMFLQRFASRVLMGVLTALVFRAASQKTNLFAACTLTGFASAFFNTLFFMSALLLFFGKTEYMQNLMAGRSALAWVVAAVGVNGLVEMAVAALVTGAVGPALKKARLF